MTFTKMNKSAKSAKSLQQWGAQFALNKPANICNIKADVDG